MIFIEIKFIVFFKKSNIILEFFPFLNTLT